MIKKTIILTLLTCIFMSCDSINNDVEEPLKNVRLKERQIASHSPLFSVNGTLLQKYIRLTAQNKTVEQITPIVRNVIDTMAYIVQYSQGWELVSGDKRIAPRLAYSETGTLDFDEYMQSGVGAINGMIDLVEDKINSSDTIVNSTWKFLSHQQRSSNSRQTRGMVSGMWVATDTSYVSDRQRVNHLISTQWNQDYPYNMLCIDNGVQCMAGCVPVAIGQLLRYYYHDNSQCNVAIPEHYNPYAGGGGQFEDFSTSNWSLLDDPINIAIFIAYLGKEKLGAIYGPSETSVTDYDSFNSTLNWANLTYSIGYSYDVNNIISSIRLGSPVLISAKKSSGTSSHTFLIDSYICDIASFLISYEWVEAYHPSDFELETYPSWRFEPSQKGDVYYEEETPITEDYSIAMNWGYAPSYNNIYYLAYHREYPYYLDGDLIIPANSNVQYSPSWQVGNKHYNLVNRYYHHFSINSNN